MTRLTCTIEGCEGYRKGFGYCNRHYRQFKKYGDPKYRYVGPGPSERFWAFVDKTGDCWRWTGCVNNNGYGCFRVSRREMVLTHRFAYEAAVGPIPAGMVIDHTCHVPACCNPEHLRIATQKQNTENLLGANRRSTTGYRGVESYNTKKGPRFGARVRHDGVRYHAGTFETAEEAAEAARQLRISLFTHNDADRNAA